MKTLRNVLLIILVYSAFLSQIAENQRFKIEARKSRFIKEMNEYKSCKQMYQLHKFKR